MKAESTSTLVPLDRKAEDTRWPLHRIIDYLPSREQQFLAKLAAHCLASFPSGKEI
jgi:hypothetical protein